LLFLPVLGLPIFWFLPLPIALPLYAAIVAASLGFYFLAMKAMRKPHLNGAEALLGAHGKVVAVGEGEVTLFLGGELWSGVASGDRLAPGDKATIVGIEGLRLRVRKAGSASLIAAHG
jgi:membrane protein implicated in regulation of membrane protease activity